jgi:alpha-L-fucosidase
LQEESVKRLAEIGQWLRSNGDAIYNTRITPQYKDENVYFTQTKTGDKLFALVCLPENQPLPATVSWKNNIPAKGTKMTLLQTGETVKWSNDNGVIKVTLPKSLQKSGQPAPALAFSFKTR